MSVRTCIVVALPAEAKPLVRHYKLKRQQNQTAFTIYTTDDISLIVCGVGKVNAAAGTAFLGNHIAEEKNAVWINFGIAGHREHAQGTLLLGHKVIDATTNESWYPPLINFVDIATAKMVSTASAENNYPDNAVYEMEASGFMPTARRFSSSELVHCIKVISDNQQQHTELITAAMVEQLCNDNLDQLDSMIMDIRQLAEQLESLQLPESIINPYLDHWHFSVTQQRQLEQLLLHWHSLDIYSPCWKSEFENEKSSKALLRSLRNYLSSQPVRLQPVGSTGEAPVK